MIDRDSLRDKIKDLRLEADIERSNASKTASENPNDRWASHEHMSAIAKVNTLLKVEDLVINSL